MRGNAAQPLSAIHRRSDALIAAVTEQGLAFAPDHEHGLLTLIAVNEREAERLAAGDFHTARRAVEAFRESNRAGLTEEVEEAERRASATHPAILPG